MDATARDPARRSGAEGERVRSAEPGPHDPRRVVGEDVLVEMVEHVVRRGARGEDVDEPEQAGFEVRPLRRPREQPGVDVEGVAHANGRGWLCAPEDLARQVLDIVLGGPRHPPVLPPFGRNAVAIE